MLYLIIAISGAALALWGIFAWLNARERRREAEERASRMTAFRARHVDYLRSSGGVTIATPRRGDNPARSRPDDSATRAADYTPYVAPSLFSGGGGYGGGGNPFSGGGGSFDGGGASSSWDSSSSSSSSSCDSSSSSGSDSGSSSSCSTD